MNDKIRRRLRAAGAVIMLYGAMTLLAIIIKSVPEDWWSKILLVVGVISATAFMYYAALDIITDKEKEEEWKNRYK